tara:strand:- start:1005 stop:1328 length:324 start_codon:yes stop_codon:yes gene_type:complete
MKTFKEFKKYIGYSTEKKKVEQKEITREDISENVVDQLRKIAKSKKQMEIKFKSGTSVPIDAESAKMILKTYDSLNSTNKKKMQTNMSKDTKSFMKVLDFAFENTTR